MLRLDEKAIILYSIDKAEQVTQGLLKLSDLQKNKSFLKSWLLDLLMGELNINCYRRCSFLMAPREFFHSQSLALFKESFSKLFVNR